MNLLHIKNISESKGISIRSIAEQIGMSEQNLHRCIRVNQIQAHQLAIISKMLATPVGYFFDDEKSLGVTANTVKGDNNVLVGGHNNGTITQLENCAKEVQHLKEIIAEKERLINVLMDKK